MYLRYNVDFVLELIRSPRENQGCLNFVCECLVREKGNAKSKQNKTAHVFDNFQKQSLYIYIDFIVNVITIHIKE